MEDTIESMETKTCHLCVSRFPVELRAEAKSLAAGKQQDLREFLIEAIREKVSLEQGNDGIAFVPFINDQYTS